MVDVSSELAAIQGVADGKEKEAQYKSLVDKLVAQKLGDQLRAFLDAVR
jgi:hypothetical protein